MITDPPIGDRVLLHLARDLRVVVDPSEVYVLEAAGGDTLVRSAEAEVLRDVRPLGALDPLFAPHGFARIGRGAMVNLRRVEEIRRREAGQDWEIKMQGPVNAVLPISRSALASVWAAFGEG